jgi:hypothetical protein
MSSLQGNNTVDLTNAEAFQLFSCKLDVALAENKKTILKEFEPQTLALQENGQFFRLQVRASQRKVQFPL